MEPPHRPVFLTLFQKQFRILFQHAAVGYDFQACVGSDFGSFFAFNPFLHPEYLGANGNGIACDFRHSFGTTETIDDIHRKRNVFQAGIRFFTQPFGNGRIDRNNLIAMFFKNFGT